MIPWILTTTIFGLAKAKMLDVRGLTNNNRYIPIKIGELKTIERYNKILHIINVTAYTKTTILILWNTQVLKSSTTESKSLLDSLHENTAILNEKIHKKIVTLDMRERLAWIIRLQICFIFSSWSSYRKLVSILCVCSCTFVNREGSVSTVIVLSFASFLSPISTVSLKISIRYVSSMYIVLIFEETFPLKLVRYIKSWSICSTIVSLFERNMQLLLVPLKILNRQTLSEIFSNFSQGQIVTLLNSGHWFYVTMVHKNRLVQTKLPMVAGIAPLRRILLCLWGSTFGVNTSNNSDVQRANTWLSYLIVSISFL